jgi:hypothetical protein
MMRIRELFFTFLCPLYFISIPEPEQCCGSGTACNFSLPDAEPDMRFVNLFLHESRITNAVLAAHFLLRLVGLRIFSCCESWDLEKFSLRLPVLVNFFSIANFIFYAFILCLAYTLVIISYYAPFIAHLKKNLQRLLYMSMFVCPGTFLFFFKPKSKTFFTVQYF